MDFLGVAFLGWLLVAPPVPASAQPFTIELDVAGKRIEAGPLSWSQEEVLLLSREGVLLSIDPDAVRTYRRTADQFQGYPA